MKIPQTCFAGAHVHLYRQRAAGQKQDSSRFFNYLDSPSLAFRGFFYFAFCELTLLPPFGLLELVTVPEMSLWSQPELDGSLVNVPVVDWSTVDVALSESSSQKC